MKRYDEDEFRTVFLSRFRSDENGCWIWQGSQRGGYGIVAVKRRATPIHRVSYEMFNGLIPEDLHIDHLCRTRLCGNPRHLEAVTQAENNRRSNKVRVYAKPEACKHGHQFDEKNTYQWKGSRYCRKCRSAAAQRVRQKNCSV